MDQAKKQADSSTSSTCLKNKQLSGGGMGRGTGNASSTFSISRIVANWMQDGATNFCFRFSSHAFSMPYITPDSSITREVGQSQSNAVTMLSLCCQSDSTLTAFPHFHRPKSVPYRRGHLYLGNHPAPALINCMNS